jgi:DNA polymerase/3'-5' exonuclease PolX
MRCNTCAVGDSGTLISCNVGDNGPQHIKGIGEAMISHIQEYLKTGTVMADEAADRWGIPQLRG